MDFWTVVWATVLGSLLVALVWTALAAVVAAIGITLPGRPS